MRRIRLLARLGLNLSTAAALCAALLGLLVPAPAYATRPDNTPDGQFQSYNLVGTAVLADDVLVGMCVSDGTHCYRPNSDSSGVLNVNVISSSPVTVADLSIRVTGQMDVAATATTVPASALSARLSLTIWNAGGASFAAMGSTLIFCTVAGTATTTTGVPILPGAPTTLSLQSGAAVTCISASGTVRIAYAEAK